MIFILGSNSIEGSFCFSIIFYFSIFSEFWMSFGSGKEGFSLFFSSVRVYVNQWINNSKTFSSVLDGIEDIVLVFKLIILWNSSFNFNQLI